jgi:hypothetical protein
LDGVAQRARRIRRPRKDRGKLGIAENERQTLAIIERARE